MKTRKMRTLRATINPSNDVVVKGGEWVRQTAKPLNSSRPLPAPSHR